MVPTDILGSPWEIQTAIAAGYAAYMVAYAGIRMRHTAIDIAFRTLVFSLVATLALTLTAHYQVATVVAIPIALVAAGVSGLIWRKWLRGLYHATLRVIDVTWSNDDQSAFETMSGNSKHRVSQIAVLLDDGTWLRCDDTAKFDKAPFGPCLLGPNGDIALYLTHEEAPGGDARELMTVTDALRGDRITYVPANRVKRVTLRHARTH